MNCDAEPEKMIGLWILVLISDQADDLSLVRACLPETVTDLHPQKLHHILTHLPSIPPAPDPSVPVEIVLGWRSPETCPALLQQLFASASALGKLPDQKQASTQQPDPISTNSFSPDPIPTYAVTLLVKAPAQGFAKPTWLTALLEQYPDVGIISFLTADANPRTIPNAQTTPPLTVNREINKPTLQDPRFDPLFPRSPDCYESSRFGYAALQWMDILPWESLQRADGLLLLTRSLRLAWQQMRSQFPDCSSVIPNPKHSRAETATNPNDSGLLAPTVRPTSMPSDTQGSASGSTNRAGNLNQEDHANRTTSAPQAQDLPTLLFLATLSALDALTLNIFEQTDQEFLSDSLAFLNKYLKSDQSSDQSINLNLAQSQNSIHQSDHPQHQIYFQRLYQLLEQAPDGCLIIDSQGIVCYANPNAVHLINRSLDELIGHHIGLPIITNQVTTIELIGSRGELHTAEMSVVPVTWNHSQGYAIVMRDISKHRQIEAQLEYRLNLETALSNISRMLATTDATLLEPVLEQVGQTTQVDRALLFWQSQSTSDLLQLACEWHSRTTPRLQDRLRSPSLKLWTTWYNTLANGRDVMISCPEDWLDASSTEHNWLQSLHLATALLSPIRDRHGQLIGVLLVGTQSQHPRRHWIDADRQLLQLVGQGLFAYQERQQVQDELRASEALYASIFNHSAEYIFLIKVTPEGDFIFETINPAFEIAIGKSVEEIQGKKAEEIFEEPYAQTSIARYRACVAGRSKITYEENMFLREEVRIWRTGLVPIFNSWNQVDRLQGSSRDITSEYRFLDQQRQQGRYLQLLASLSLKIRKALTFNDILALTVGELQRTLQTSRVFFVEICPDGVGEIREDTCKSKYKSSQRNQLETHHLTTNLSRYMNGNVLIQKCNHANYMNLEISSSYSQNHDLSSLISDRSRKQKNSQNDSSTLFQAANNREYHDEFLDDQTNASEPWLHQSASCSASHSTSSWVVPQSQLIVPVLISRSAAQTINRGYVPLSQSNNYQYDQDSGLIGLLILQEFEKSRDWTSFEQELLQQLATQLGLALHQAQLLEERAEYIDKLARSNEDLEQFAYVVSHDLQEPLRGAIGFSELLLEDYGDQLDEVGYEYIHFILDSSLRMRQLIRDLLTLSRVGTHGHVFKDTDCNLVLEDVLSNLHAAIEESEAQIIVPHLPVVWGDHLQLVQLFQNLLGNALKFRSDRPPQIQIQVSQHHENQWLFCFKDNGIGFDQHHGERIFQVFQRLHDRETYEGTGMGLTICRKIVERHHGSIWVESQLHQGSTFYVTLPMGLTSENSVNI